MKKHKSKIISALVITALLTLAWFYGGSHNVYTGDSFNELLPALATADETTHETVTDAIFQNEDTAQDSAQTEIAEIHEESIMSESKENSSVLEDAQDEPVYIVQSEEQEAKPKSNDKPLSAETQDTVLSDGEFTVTLSVRCDTILNNMHLLNREKHELIPPDGIIFPPTVVTAFEGESVFNVLQREMRRAGIHMEFRNTPIFDSAYVMGINNIYEFDAGELSGWMYRVNGWFPNFGSSRYLLSPGDVIEWIYTCDLGRDIGAAWTGGQRDE